MDHYFNTARVQASGADRLQVSGLQQDHGHSSSARRTRSKSQNRFHHEPCGDGEPAGGGHGQECRGRIQIFTERTRSLAISISVATPEAARRIVAPAAQHAELETARRVQQARVPDQQTEGVSSQVQSRRIVPLHPSHPSKHASGMTCTCKTGRWKSYTTNAIRTAAATSADGSARIVSSNISLFSCRVV